ncbi:hypothetical protein G7L40_02100 [Paenibacillus polymyxa]|uniref:Bacteriophage SP-beta YorD domain-containing protein n=1 Tax=Paenibacillus polymyxa TaxID=1406 RepID=A0A378XWH8_PAEPO|nr:hypothetical protein [Paenibacillus polymyxa]MBE7897495.1 hypothetical protein [Paenibacillus polymyxa]MBG9766223.1 hypothetical protein [Paenibacillus polymyxa]MCC3257254.1 hypothetical protein [Paenibacillus polymyxa]QPK51251.1 hypothetical protein G7035_02095 [Paenibacillus polymyxa]QPK56347.1 hypothetical protein G7L40_02100 [Paenibacillus polymyxa]
MKSAAKVNTDGLYLEDELVDDAFSGVVPFYAQPDNTDQDEGAEPKKPELVGYTVGVPITTPGLYKPKFDLVAWKAYESAVYEAQEAYISALDDWQAKGRAEGEQPVYVAPRQPDNLWTEGLTPEQIAELTKQPEPQPKLREELTNTQIAMADMYEQMLAMQAELKALKEGR